MSFYANRGYVPLSWPSVMGLYIGVSERTGDVSMDLTGKVKLVKRVFQLGGLSVSPTLGDIFFPCPESIDCLSKILSGSC